MEKNIKGYLMGILMVLVLFNVLMFFLPVEKSLLLWAIYLGGMLILLYSLVKLGLYLSGIILGGQKIVAREQEIDEKVFYIKVLQGNLERVAMLMAAQENNVEIKKLIELVRFSDPISHSSLSGLESELESRVDLLEQAVKANDMSLQEALIEELKELFLERNRKCKVLK